MINLALTTDQCFFKISSIGESLWPGFLNRRGEVGLLPSGCWSSYGGNQSGKTWYSGGSLVLPRLPEAGANRRIGTGLFLKATGTHLTIRTGAGQDLSLAFHSRVFRLPYQVPFPDSSQDRAGASKHPPTQAHAPHPSAWRASPTAPGAPGQESARTRPPAPPPAHSPNSYGWSKERVGARHAGACRSPAARGVREDALRAPQRLLLTRPPTATGRCATLLEKNGTSEKNQELNLSGIMSLVP